MIQFLVRKLGPYQERNNGEYGFECPDCSHNMGKFHMGVNINKGLFNCFRCGHSGHVRQLGVEIQDLRSKKAQLSEKLDLPILPSFIPYGSDKMSLATIKQVERFLVSRGISKLRATEMRVGCSVDIKLTGRLLLPIYEQGVARYWVARRMCNDGAPAAKEIGPKSGLGWDRRSEVLYGLDEILTGVHVVVCEGIFDAEHLKNFGYHAVSILGSNVSDIQVGKILGKIPTKISVFFDGDEGGRHGAKRMLGMLRLRFRGNICIVETPDGMDPDDCDLKVCKRYLDTD